MQEFRDKRLLRYGKNDFFLGNQLSLASVNANIRNYNRKNVLISFRENTVINHQDDHIIRYQRLNHLNFVFNIRLRNPYGVKRKVIIRLWLAKKKDKKGRITYDPENGSYNPLDAIAMDKFVHVLSGASTENITRHSRESASTMHDPGMSLSRMREDIVDEKKRSSWCGLPHNLFLPRSGKGSEGSQEFVLIAIVNEVAQDVVEGADGVSHMLCGHPDRHAVLDSRSFGFPFDRKIDTDIHQLRSVAAATTSSVSKPGTHASKNSLGKRTKKILKKQLLTIVKENQMKIKWTVILICIFFISSFLFDC